jgi:curli biogenesis system outer membrane secretion channel CsgG
MKASDLILIVAGFLGLFLLMTILYGNPTGKQAQIICPKVITTREPVRVAIVRFADASGLYGKLLDMFGWDIKKSLPIMVETALQLQRNFRVYAREQLVNLVIEEQKFENLEGYVDPSTAVKIGKLTGIQYLITGMITDFATRTLPTPIVQPTASTFTVDFRMIDTTTGEIVLANAVSGTAMGGGLGKLDLGTIQRAARDTANKVAESIASCVVISY